MPLHAIIMTWFRQIWNPGCYSSLTMKMNEVLDEYYDLVEVYKELDPCDQEMIWSIIQIVKKTSEKKKSANMQKRVE